MNTYWISLPCDLLSSLASFQCSLLHHLHLSSDLGLSKYINQHSHLNLSRNVRLSVLYDLDFNKFDRMIPSGSSCLMGIKTQRLVCQVHLAIEPGKSVPIWKFHQLTGHTGKYLMKATADYMDIKLTGKLDPCEACAQVKPTYQIKRNHRFPADQGTGCLLISVHSNMKVWEIKDIG